MEQRYLAPEGFELDPNSGFYYRYDYVNEEDGTQTCWITWFDTESGDYTQQIYEESTPEQAEAVEEPTPEPKEIPEETVEDAEPTQIKEPVEAYFPPENYIFHQKSGLYYSLYTYENAEGQTMDFVTWFDAQTGEYAQVEYLIAHPSIEAVPELEREEQIVREMRKEDSERNEERIRRGILAVAAVVLVAIVGITLHFNIWDNFPLPFINHEKNQTIRESANSKIAKDCSLQVKVESPKTAVIKLKVPNLKSEYPAYDASMNEGQVLYDWRVQFGDYAISLMQTSREENKGDIIETKDMQSSLWKYKNKNNFDTVEPFVEVGIEDNVIEWTVTVPDEDFDFQDIDKYIVSVTEKGQTGSQKFSAKSVVEKQAVSSATFPHNNLYELMADEDEDYVYTIHMADPYWKFTMGALGGPIYRIKKDDKQAVPEKIIDIGDGTYTAASIAVLGDYIYFSTYTYRTVDGVDQYAYFRAPKKGGKVEKLFEADPSYIRAYEGKLYFLFTYKNEYGVYDPETKNLSYVSINTSEMFDPMQGGARSEFHLFLPFSVYKGELYVGGSFDYVGYYYKVSLSDGQMKKVATSPLDGISENDEGAVFLYGTNPLYLKDLFVLNTDRNAFICRTAENRVAVDKSSEGKGLVFKRIYEDESGIDNNTILLEVPLSEDSKPYAGVGNWIFLNDRAICVEKDAVKETAWFKDAKDKSSKWDMSQVKESVN